MRNINVKSAIKLTAEQKKRLEKAFASRYEGEDVVFSYSIDNIVGGVVVIDGETVYDASVATRLQNVKKCSEDLINGKRGLTLNDLPMFLSGELDVILHKPFDRNNSGKVVSCADGIITIEGLSECRYYELIVVDKDKYAIAMNLMTDCVKAMMISPSAEVEYGALAFTTGRIVEVPVGESLLGRVINPLGKPIDGLQSLHFDATRKIEMPAPMIVEREPVSRPLQTGILAIDSMIPIGKGQRELIIGDRQTGKSSIAIDTIINQRGKNVICIYVAIGQRAGIVSQLLRSLKEADALKYTVMVVSTADESTPLQYIAPYTGCTIGEHFMREGKDVLIVYDDLTKHANAYRSISLLLKRPSGREAYPGDVFYIHSRLLERSAQLSKEAGGGSMTALPIIETQAGDISQYIPTNVISITDGQIYLESQLFHSGVRPAVNVGLSVSRVGGSAQVKAIRKLSSKLRLDLAHYREMALFTQFGAAEVDDNTKSIIEQGEKVTELLKQDERNPMEVDKQIIYLYLINGRISSIPKKLVKQYLEGFYHYLISTHYGVMTKLRKSGEWTDETEKTVAAELDKYDVFFRAENDL